MSDNHPMCLALGTVPTAKVLAPQSMGLRERACRQAPAASPTGLESVPGGGPAHLAQPGSITQETALWKADPP